MLNHIDIMGRMVRDPELRHTQNGVAVCSFTLAADRDYKGDDGKYGVDFVDVVAWRATGEFVAKYFAKGRMAVVSGRLQSRKYQDRSGNNRTAWEVLAENVYFGGDSRRETAPAPSDADAPPAPASAAAPVQDFAPMEDDDSELPF